MCTSFKQRRDEDEHDAGCWHFWLVSTSLKPGPEVHHWTLTQLTDDSVLCTFKYLTESEPSCLPNESLETHEWRQWHIRGSKNQLAWHAVCDACIRLSRIFEAFNQAWSASMPAINLNHKPGLFFNRPANAFAAQIFNWAACQRFWVTVCFVLIGFVSAIDMYLVEANPGILDAEQNPICLALMKMEPDSKIYFFVAKSVGSFSVLLTIWYLIRIRYRYATIVLLSVAIFQILLLTYLCLGDSRIGGFPNFALLFQDTPESIFRLSERR
jgi:hypothetical protein